jgi:probable phosphoglycerate mutase
MTTFLLVRHGNTDAVGSRLMGWKRGCHLNKEGREQARRLAQSLSWLAIEAIYTSPLERAVETAEIIGAERGITPCAREDLGELRFGQWEGRTFDELNQDSEWDRFNTTRSMIRAPGGELMIEAQTRIVNEVENLRRQHDGENVVVVSHADLLRVLIAYYLGMPLDLLLRFEISPASVSVVRFWQERPSVLCVNHTGEIPI